jgi:UrcA family protein
LLLKEITMLRTLATAAALAIALNVTAALAADDAPNYASTNVYYGDLDLSQAADAKVLADRLQGAAKSVCLATNPNSISPALMRHCVDGSVGMAMSQIASHMGEAVRAKLGNVRTAMQNP